MNPVRRLEKKYPGAYARFVRAVSNPQGRRARLLAAMLLKMDEVQRRYEIAAAHERMAHDGVDAPVQEGVRQEYEEAKEEYFRLLNTLKDAGYPADKLPALY